MKVFTLITIPNKEAYVNCTMFLDTIRVGFPTTEITAYLNYDSLLYEDEILSVAAGITFIPCTEQIHHAKFIEKMVEENEDKIVIIDPDTIYWSSLEDKLEFDTLLAGRYVPPMWNEFSQCVSHDRLHTSMLVFSDCKELKRLLKEMYPQSHNTINRTNEFAPLNPFIPRVQYVNKTPLFWDTCSCLFNMIGGSTFTEEQLDCYDHINSSSFGEIMYKAMEYGSELYSLHKAVAKDPSLLKGRWKNDEAYYYRMNQKAFPTQSQI